MKKIIIIISLFNLFYSPLLFAQLYVRPFIGDAIPSGDFGNLYNNSFLFGGDIKYIITNKSAIQISVSHQLHSAGQDIQFRYIPINFNIILFSPSLESSGDNITKFIFLANVGSGFYFETAYYENNFAKVISGKDVGFNIGIGIEIVNLINNLPIIINSNYHVILSPKFTSEKKTKYLTITVGVDIPIKF